MKHLTEFKLFENLGFKQLTLGNSLFGGYYYFNHKVSTKDTSIIMNTQQSLPNKEESVNLSMNTSYVLKNDNITYSVPLEYKVNKSIIKSEIGI